MNTFAISRVTKAALNVQGDHFPSIGMRTAHRLQHQRRMAHDPEYAAKHGPKSAPAATVVVEKAPVKRTRKPAAPKDEAPVKPRARTRKAAPVTA